MLLILVIVDYTLKRYNMGKEKKYKPKITAEDYEKLTGQGLGRLTKQSDAVINGVVRPSNG